MITYIKISGFKSFHEMEMEFRPFTVIAGANASGKSNLFDALQLLSRLAEADSIKKAFTEQRGEFIELFTQYDGGLYANEMSFKVEMLVSGEVKDAWGNRTNLKYTRLRYELAIKRVTNEYGIEDLLVAHESLEKLNHSDDKWVKLIPSSFRNQWRPPVATGKRGIPYMDTIFENNIPTVLIPQDGPRGGNKRRVPLINATRTVLSSFDNVDFPHVLAVKEELKSWKFLRLNPDDLRRPTRKNTGGDVISQSGENLAGALHRIKVSDPYAVTEISRKLQSFLPNFTEVDVIDDLENRQYVIQLSDADGKKYSSRVLSEGTLRLLTLCILQYDDAFSGLLCFEEPENGVHPFRIGAMARLLRDMRTSFEDADEGLRQIIVNTHSPVLLSEINGWIQNKDKLTGMWYSEMHKRIMNTNNGRISVAVTVLRPVHENDLFSEKGSTDNRLTVAIVNEYLNTLSASN